MPTLQASEKDFSDQIDEETGIINLGSIHCESAEDVIHAPLLLELIGRITQEMTEIVAGRLMSEHDFRAIKSLYERVFIKGEKILSKTDYELLKNFLDSEGVKERFIKLLDVDYIRMHGAPKKTKALTDDILKLSASDRDKFGPILKYLKSKLAHTREVDEQIMFGYNLTASHRTENNKRGSQRDKELELHSYRVSGGENTFGLVMHLDGRLIESQNSDYTQILDTHECDGIKILRAKKGAGQEGYLGIIDNQIVEISTFDFNSRIQFSAGNPSLGKKESGKGILFFNGVTVEQLTSFDFTELNIPKGVSTQIARKKTGYGIVHFDGTSMLNLTDFNYTKIESCGVGGVYVLHMGTKEKEVVHISPQGKVKKYAGESFTAVDSFHNDTVLGEEIIVGRVYRGKKGGYVIVSGDKIEEFSDLDFTDVPLFQENAVMYAKKEEGKGIVEITKSGVEVRVSCNYKEITESFTVGGIKAYKAVKGNGVYELVYCVNSVWKETNYDIKDTTGISTGNLGRVKKSDGTYIIVQMGKEGLDEVIDSCQGVEAKDDNSDVLCVTDKAGYVSLCIKQKDGNILKSSSEFTELSWPDNRGIVTAQKNTGYGLLKVEGNSIIEISNFDFSNELDLEEYSKYILSKDTGKGIAKFAKEGVSELTKFDFEEIGSFDSRNFARVKKGGKYGVMYRKGDIYTVALECEYIEIGEFNENGLAFASKNGEGYGLLQGKSGQVQEFSDSFHFTLKSLNQVISGEYRVWRMFTDVGGEQREGFAAYSKNGLRDMGEYNYEDIDKWNTEGNVFYGKIAGGNWGAMKQIQNEIQIIGEHHDYIDAPSSIGDKKLDVFQKDSGFGVVYIKGDVFEELSDFNYESLPQIHTEGKYIAKKNGKFGMVCYFDHKISEGSNFIFDNEWDPDSTEIQENTIDGKKVIFYNTPLGVQIMEEGIESLEVYDKEQNLSLMQKDGKKALVKEVEVDGRIDYEYISQFAFTNFGKTDRDGFVIAQKDAGYGVLTFIDGELREINIIDQADSSLGNDINFKCESIERYTNETGTVLFKVHQNAKQLQIFGYRKGAMFSCSDNDYFDMGDLEPYNVSHAVGSGVESETVFRAVNTRKGKDGVSEFDQSKKTFIDVADNKYDEIRLFSEFAIVNERLKDSILFLGPEREDGEREFGSFKNIQCLDEDKILFLMTHDNGANSLYTMLEGELTEISPRMSSIDDIVYEGGGEVLIKCYERGKTGILRQDENGGFALDIKCEHSNLSINNGKVLNPDKMGWFQNIALSNT